MSKDDAISVMNNSKLIDKKGVLWFFLLIYKKWVSVTPLNAIPSSLMKKRIIKETKNLILKRAKDYYENDKIKRSRDKYRNLSEEEKN